MSLYPRPEEDFMGSVSDNASFTLHIMAGSGVFDYSIRHHLGSANQDEEAPLTAAQLAALRAAARLGQSQFNTALPSSLATVMSSGAKANMRAMVLHLDELPGS